MLEHYSKEKKIVLLGSFPPPIGGVSIYLDRLALLLKDNEFNVFRWNIAGNRIVFYINLFKYFFLFLFKRNYILHVHVLNNKYLIFTLLLKYLTGVELYITNHNTWFVESCSNNTLLLLKIIVNKADKFFVVSSSVLNIYAQKGIKIKSKVIIQNAFIPPRIENETNIVDTYSNETIDFFRNKFPVIISNAFQLVFYKGTDLYGLDMCIELTAKLKMKFQNVGFVFAVANAEYNIDYLNKIRKKISELNIEENFHFITDQKEIWPLFKKAQLFIRPTSSDGYGISIDEALYFGCKAIASDVCERAPGTILFKSRDLNDLYNKSYSVLIEIKQ